MIADSFQFIHLDRLKIPCLNGRAGSSPAPSISKNQRVKFILSSLFYCQNLRITHFLRTPVQQTSINPDIDRFININVLSGYSIFCRGTRGKRGNRGKNLPRMAIGHDVADVATLIILLDLATVQITQSYFELRKYCVILGSNPIKITSKTVLKSITHKIVNPLLLFIPVFCTLFSLLGGTHGNN